MFRGFFDESNRNPSEIKFIMAGWTARVEDWEKFSELWQECLSQRPSIEYFKTSESNGQSGEFFKCSKADAESKRLSLARVISNQNIRGYVTTVNHETLRDRPERLKKRMGMGMRIYDWGFISMITTVLQDFFQRGEASEKIDFVFDGCNELRACIASYELQREKFPPSLQKIAGEVIPGDDRELAGLQAADLLAGEYSTYLKTGTRGNSYAELMNSKVPLIEFPAMPPQEKIRNLICYSQEVYEREKFVIGILKQLRAKGVTLADLKKFGL